MKFINSPCLKIGSAVLAGRCLFVGFVIFVVLTLEGCSNSKSNKIVTTKGIPVGSTNEENVHSISSLIDQPQSSSVSGDDSFDLDPSFTEHLGPSNTTDEADSKPSNESADEDFDFPESNKHIKFLGSLATSNSALLDDQIADFADNNLLETQSEKTDTQDVEIPSALIQSNSSVVFLELVSPDTCPIEPDGICIENVENQFEESSDVQISKVQNSFVEKTEVTCENSISTAAEPHEFSVEVTKPDELTSSTNILNIPFCLQPLPASAEGLSQELTDSTSSHIDNSQVGHNEDILKPVLDDSPSLSTTVECSEDSEIVSFSVQNQLKPFTEEDDLYCSEIPVLENFNDLSSNSKTSRPSFLKIHASKIRFLRPKKLRFFGHRSLISKRKIAEELNFRGANFFHFGAQIANCCRFMSFQDVSGFYGMFRGDYISV
jgi:hypothetical protein